MSKFRYKTSQGTFEIDSNRPLQPQELQSVIQQGAGAQPDTGTIRAPRAGERFISGAKRAGAAAAKGVAGDVPFLRKLLPESVQQFQAFSAPEKAVEAGARIGRDIGLLKGVGKVGAARTALRGAGLGLATAGTEDPGEMLGAGARSAAATVALKKGFEKAVPVIQRIAGKGLKSLRQAQQDLLRAGFSVEKESVQRVQEKGVNAVFGKATGNRDSDAFLKLGQRIFDSAQSLRRGAGKTIQRWRQRLFNNPKVKVSLENSRGTFQNELKQPDVGLLSPEGAEVVPFEVGSNTAQNRLLEINRLLTAENQVRPETAYRIIDKLDDLISDTRSGALSVGKNVGRIVSNLRRDLKTQILRSAPRNISKGLGAAETKFAEIAEATDKVFRKLPLRKEGVSFREAPGATENFLRRVFREGQPIENAQILEKLNELLPPGQKFIEKFKDISAAQDFGRHIGGFIRRQTLFSPRAAATTLSATQPIGKAIGGVASGTGRALEQLIPPLALRRLIQGNRQ